MPEEVLRPHGPSNLQTVIIDNEAVHGQFFNYDVIIGILEK